MDRRAYIRIPRLVCPSPRPGHAGRPGPWALARMLPGTLGARVCSSPRFQGFRVLPPKQGCGVVWSFWVTVSREPVAVALASALSFARLLMSCSSQRNSPPVCLEERCSHLPGTPVPGQDSVRLCRGSCVCFLPASAAPRGAVAQNPVTLESAGPPAGPRPARAEEDFGQGGRGGRWPRPSSGQPFAVRVQCVFLLPASGPFSPLAGSLTT